MASLSSAVPNAEIPEKKYEYDQLFNSMKESLNTIFKMTDTEIMSLLDGKPPKSKFTPEEIRLQVEYYFSDSNILDDGFLLELIQKDAEGWVDLSVINGFKKMRNFGATMEEIVGALKESRNLALREEPSFAVRRIAPLPERDPDFERRHVLLSGMPETEIKKIKDLVNKLAEHELVPKCIKCFPPYNNAPKDLKAAFNRHKFPKKKFYLIECDNIVMADKTRRVLRGIYPEAYSNLLSWKPNLNGQGGNSKKKQTILDVTPLPRSNDAERPRLKLRLHDPNKPQMTLIRDPIIPPSEDSVGFKAGWREKLMVAQSNQLPASVEAIASFSGVDAPMLSMLELEDPAILTFVS